MMKFLIHITKLKIYLMEILKKNIGNKKILIIGHGLSLMAIISIGIVAFIARVDSNVARLDLPFIKSIPIGTCSFKTATGVNCPTCGLTRSFIKLAEGDLVASLNYHPLGVYLVVLLILIAMLNLAYLMNIKKIKKISIFVIVLAILITLLVVGRWIVNYGSHIIFYFFT